MRRRRIILHLFFLRRFIDARFELECQVTLYGVEACPPAHHVDGLEAASRYEPGARLVRKAGLRPRLQGGSESFVHGLFGEIEIGEQSHQRCQNPGRFRAVKCLKDSTQQFGRIRQHPCQASKRTDSTQAHYLLPRRSVLPKRPSTADQERKVP